MFGFLKPKSRSKVDQDPVQVLDIAFAFDLTLPDAKRLEVGTLRVRGDNFVSFDWTVDDEAVAFHIHPMAATLFRSLPQTLRSVADQWPAFRDRAVPPHQKERDPQTLADYYCLLFGPQSSIYVSGVRPG